MTTPAGWYDDGQGSLRWWDGATWTEHTQPKADAAPAPAAAAEDVPAAQEPASSTDVSAPAASETDGAAPTSAASDPGAAEGPADTSSTTGAPAVDAALTAPAPTESGVAAPSAAPAAPAASGSPSYAPASAPQGSYGVPPQGPPPAYGGQPYGQQPTGPVQPYGQSYGVAPAQPVQPAKKKSKLWLILLIAGVVLIGVIVLAIVLISNLLRGGGEGISGETGATDDERAAIAAVALYDDSYDTSDFDAYTEATTSAFREAFGFTDSAEFEDFTERFGETTSDYRIEVTDVETEGDVILVETEETYTATVDADGNELAEPQPAEDDYTYTLVQEDGRWAIDAVD